LKKLAIIGAGYAGISAAVHLDKIKYDITIFEQKSEIGGRASSFYDKINQLELDNGQHMLMKCYHETFKIFDHLNISKDNFFIDKKMFIPYLSQKHGEYYFKSNPYLPAPLHLSQSIFFDLKPLRFIEKIRLILAFLALQVSKSLQNLPLNETLGRLKQSENVIKYIWKPILISVFNDDAENIVTKDFTKVMKILFFQKNDNANVVLARKNLSSLLQKPFEHYCSEKNIKLKLSSRVKNFTEIKNDEFRINDQKYDYVLSTISLQHLSKEIQLNKDHYSIKSIVTIYFNYTETLFNHPFIGLPESKLHWVFNLNHFEHDSIELYSVVISNADQYLNYHEDEFKALLIEELTKFFPRFNLMNFTYLRTVHEKKASYNAKQKHKIGEMSKNFFICGDWTDTSLPSTIESAVISGKNAANIMNYL
jgi:hydroxysqualene dehydroxylase